MLRRGRSAARGLPRGPEELSELPCAVRQSRGRRGGWRVLCPEGATEGPGRWGVAAGTRLATPLKMTKGRRKMSKESGGEIYNH